MPGEVTAITQVAALSEKGKFHLNCQSLAVRVRALWSLPGGSPVAGWQAIQARGGRARVADELAEARLKKGKTYRDLYWGASGEEPGSPSGES